MYRKGRIVLEKNRTVKKAQQQSSFRFTKIKETFSETARSLGELKFPYQKTFLKRQFIKKNERRYQLTENKIRFRASRIEKLFVRKGKHQYNRLSDFSQLIFFIVNSKQLLFKKLKLDSFGFDSVISNNNADPDENIFNILSHIAFYAVEEAATSLKKTQ